MFDYQITTDERASPPENGVMFNRRKYGLTDIFEQNASSLKLHGEVKDWRNGHFPLQTDFEYAPATEEELAATEETLGRALPPFCVMCIPNWQVGASVQVTACKE